MAHGAIWRPGAPHNRAARGVLDQVNARRSPESGPDSPPTEN